MKTIDAKKAADGLRELGRSAGFAARAFGRLHDILLWQWLATEFRRHGIPFPK